MVISTILLLLGVPLWMIGGMIILIITTVLEKGLLIHIKPGVQRLANTIGLPGTKINFAGKTSACRTYMRKQICDAF